MEDGQPILEETWVRVVARDIALAWGAYHDECARRLGIDVDSLPVVRTSVVLGYAGPAPIVRVQLD